MRRYSMDKLGIGVLGAVIVAVAGAAASAQVVFSESVFQAITVDQVIGGASQGMAGGFASYHGYGNPTQGCYVVHQIHPGAPIGGYCAIWVWSFVSLFPHAADPAALGGLSTIDFSIDSLGIFSEPVGTPIVQSQTAAIKQSGKWYISIVGPGVTPQGNTWATTTVSGLRAVDFAEVVNTAPCLFVDVNSHPDFSPNGTTMQLGFARGNSSGVGGNAVHTAFGVMADNWSMTLHDCGLRIIGDPNSASTCPNGPAWFSVQAEAPSSSGPLSYRWEARQGSTGQWIPLVEGENTGIGEVEGTTRPDLHVVHAHGTGGTMRCVVWGPCTFLATEPADLILCVADTDDGSGIGTCDGGVTIDDLLFYLVNFERGGLETDVDDGSATGTPDGGVTIDDLLYYLVRFEAGC